jgi:CheY-like chemotaxis protein
MSAARGDDAVKSGEPGVLLVDDEPRLRGQLGALLGDYGIAVVGEAGNGREGVELACRLRPDVVLMDMRMPELRRNRGHPPALAAGAVDGGHRPVGL